MSKLRVHELARELGRQNKEVIEFLKSKGIDVKSHMSMVDEPAISIVRDRFKKNNNRGKEHIAKLDTPKTEEKVVTAKSEGEKADTQKKKKRKARTHLLIQKGAAIEAICKDTKYLTEAEFYQLMDELLHDPACKFCDVVHEMVRGRAETAEVKERELAEEEALLKAMKRGELPQGDE